LFFESYSLSAYCCEGQWKKDTDTVTPIIVTKAPGSALIIQLYLPAVRQDPGGQVPTIEKSIRTNFFYVF